MMKTKLFLLLTLFAPTLMGAKVIPTTTGPSLTTSVVPVKECFCENFDINFSYTLSSTMTDKFVFTVNIEDGDFIVRETFTKSCSGSTKNYSFNVTVPSEDYLGIEGMTIEVSVKQGKRGVLLESSLPIISTNKVKINPYTMSSFKEVSASKITKNKLVYYYDAFNFNYVNYFINDRYYRLDLSSYNFDITDCYNFSYEEAYIVLTNVPKCISEFNLYKIFINLNTESNKVKLSIKTQLYVDPKTLMPSIYSHPGYEPTKHLYFPLNHIGEFDNMIVNFNFLGMGLNKSDVKFSSSFSAGYYLLGDCQSSEYCVTGGAQ